MRKLFPIIVLWGEEIIDVKNQKELIVPMIYVSSNAKLSIINADIKDGFVVRVNGNLTIREGGIINIK